MVREFLQLLAMMNSPFLAILLKVFQSHHLVNCDNIVITHTKKILIVTAMFAKWIKTILKMNKISSWVHNKKKKHDLGKYKYLWDITSKQPNTSLINSLDWKIYKKGISFFCDWTLYLKLKCLCFYLQRKEELQYIQFGKQKVLQCHVNA